MATMNLSRRSFGRGLAGVAGLAAAGCDFVYQRFRYRMTVEVISDGQVRRDSSVQAYMMRPSADGGRMDVGEFHTRGECVIVDLGAAGVLVATLAGMAEDAQFRPKRLKSGGWSVFRALEDQLHVSGLSVPQFVAWANTLGRVALSPANMPFLATFADVPDPLTVRVGSIRATSRRPSGMARGCRASGSSRRGTRSRPGRSLDFSLASPASSPSCSMGSSLSASSIWSRPSQRPTSGRSCKRCLSSISAGAYAAGKTGEITYLALVSPAPGKLPMMPRRQLQSGMPTEVQIETSSPGALSEVFQLVGGQLARTHREP